MPSLVFFKFLIFFSTIFGFELLFYNVSSVLRKEYLRLNKKLISPFLKIYSITFGCFMYNVIELLYFRLKKS